RFGICKALSSDYCVIVTPVRVIASKGDEITLRPVDGSNDVVVTRIGGADVSAFSSKDTIWLEFYQSEFVAVSNRPTGALMKLENYPEVPLRFWVPEVSIGLFGLVVWIGCFLWRRHLFASLAVRSSA